MLVLPLFCSCLHDSFSGCPDYTQVPDTNEYSNLTLVLNVNGDPRLISRTSENPLGGEDGNGLRLGEHHENDIENLCIFAFADEGRDGVSGLPGNTPVKYCRYVEDVNFHPTYANTFYSNKLSTEVNIRFDGKIVHSTDAFLVLANVGDKTSEVTNLQDVRNLLVTKTLTRPASADAPLADCTQFAMANANNSTNLGGKGTETDPYKVAVDIERITARVDFWFAPTLDESNKPEGLADIPLLGYKVVDKYDNSTQLGWMYISHIKLINVAQYAPYALKRLAATETATPDYLGDEQHENDEAVKYVVEPYTWEKPKGTLTHAMLYGNTHMLYAIQNYNQSNFFTATEAVRNYATPQTFPNNRDGFNAGWSKDSGTSGESYYVLDYINENTIAADHTSGYNTTSLLLKTKFIPNTLHYIDGTSLQTRSAQYGETFWAMEVMTADKRIKLYFATEEAANLYKSQNPSYTFAAPVEYVNGDNYYTIWIRHDNNGDDATIGKMEYGIVRNNIYRIGVERVVGPGSPAPLSVENPEDINLHIYVRKWNFMEVPTIKI